MSASVSVAPILERCQHPRSEVRWRVDVGGRRYYVRQCLGCGASVGSAIAAVVALGDGDRNPPPFDEKLLARSRASRERFYDELDRSRSERQQAFWDWYEAYLQSDAWRTKRARVLKRDNGLCQGCLERPATQVHHLTYAHVGDELLFELTSICEECHEHTHEVGS